MPPTKKSGNRPQQILEALAFMLESEPGSRITTARLARQVGVSEAALYRHFPSKARMFEGLLVFVEESLFSRVRVIGQETGDAAGKCGQLLNLLLAFADRNPGICRLLTGDALVGEQARLRERVSQVFGRLEVQMKQWLREEAVRTPGVRTEDPGTVANMLMAAVEGRIAQYVRSDFSQSPLAQWPAQWQLLSRLLEMPVAQEMRSGSGSPIS